MGIAWGIYPISKKLGYTGHLYVQYMTTMFDFSHNPVIAHRGASAYAPENTLVAFDLALAYGAEWIEFDVMLSHDKEPFVFHDDSLTRTTNGHGEIAEVEATYLNGLDAGAWFSRKFSGEPIPHLRAVLKWLAFSNMQANIEIKAYRDTSAEETAIITLAHIHRYWPSENPLPLISSFDISALTACRNLAPEAPLGLLLDQWDPQWQKHADHLGCTSVHVNHTSLTKERIQEIKTAGYLLLSYTVNRKHLAEKLLAFGVDAVFSDYPDLLR